MTRQDYEREMRDFRADLRGTCTVIEKHLEQGTVDTTEILKLLSDFMASTALASAATQDFQNAENERRRME